MFASQGKTKKLVWACAITYVGVLAAVFFYRDASFSRLFVLLSAIFLFLLTIISRISFRVVLARRCQNGDRVRILVIGADQYAQRAARSLVAGQVMPCTLVGFVRLADQTAAVADGPIYEMADIEELARANGIDDAVIAIPPQRFSEIPAILSELSPLCVPTRAVLDLGDGVFVRDRLFDFGGIVMLDLHAHPTESVMYFLLKRLFDFAFSALVLILMSPLLLLTSVLIKLSSRGPVLFVQERVGLNGQIFRMYKFRTMKASSSRESDTRWTVPDDPRRTKLGAFLRKTNLDELPQFWNVIKGDMSIVGPRPERPHFVEKFLRDIETYHARHYLKVGITGWAQVNGWRGDTSIATRVEHDLYYLRNWSLTFDLQIILLTIFRVFVGRNAY
ncbi:MAG: exopolysaccharide biosynthesis polyprenyl glycosylphosphotransferase [Acidobacteria bacterium]|nr:exopolysaccharide biosynthesis polyprenyl glycosylphosphotransferase [Acidobacteriota bacterium]